MSPIEPEADQVTALGALAEPNRRRLYDVVVAHGGLISRDEAAAATGLERATAAHHLDRLAADGLLEFVYQRRTGRVGPGAGRPAKLYRRSSREFDLSLPPRDYELAGQLLAEAVDLSRTSGQPVAEALDVVASAEGERLAEDLRTALDSGSAADPEAAILDGLRRHGFEPTTLDDGTIVLTNCPFHHLAERHTDLICGMNHCLLTAATEAFADGRLDAALEPADDVCCVRFHPRRGRRDRGPGPAVTPARGR